MIWTFFIFVITISLLVTIHEFGHFITARLCGVTVKCFSIGFGKKLWTHKSKRGTEFAISAIPLGGYVKMLDSRNEEISEGEQPFAFDKKSVLKRAAIVSAGPIANFILAIILYWVIFQIGVQVAPVQIQQTMPNTPASSVNIPQGAELKSIAGIKIDSWSDASFAIMSELGKDTIDITYETKDNVLKSQTINISNWRFDIEKESPITAFGLIPESSGVYPVISKIVPNSAAESAGLRVGDEIIKYNNKRYDNWAAFSELIRENDSLTLSIRRDDKVLDINLEPKREINQQGKVVGVAGIYPSSNTIIKQYDIVGAFTKAVRQTSLTTKLVARSFYQLLTGVLSIKNLSGPVTIAQGAGQTASYGFVPYLFFLAFISISLGVVNLVPLPMLDGGHLLFLVIEKIKGSPLSDGTQETCYRFGFILLMAIMGIGLFNDFIRLS